MDGSLKSSRIKVNGFIYFCLLKFTSHVLAYLFWTFSMIKHRTIEEKRYGQGHAFGLWSPLFMLKMFLQCFIRKKIKNGLEMSTGRTIIKDKSRTTSLWGIRNEKRFLNLKFIEGIVKHYKSGCKYNNKHRQQGRPSGTS